MRWLECARIRTDFPLTTSRTTKNLRSASKGLPLVSFLSFNWFPNHFPTTESRNSLFLGTPKTTEKPKQAFSFSQPFFIRALGDYLASKKQSRVCVPFFLFSFYTDRAFDMERRSRNWTLGFSLIAFFGLLFSIGFVSPVKADDVQDYGTVIGIVCCFPSPFHRRCAPLQTER